MVKKKALIQAEVQAAKLGMRCYESFYFFFITFWPEMSGETFQDAPHIKYICDTLQYWGEKVIKRERLMKTIVVNVPPGSSKSTIATIAFPLWCWIHSPNISTANISYSASLSAGHAFKSRGILDSEKWHVLFDNIFKVMHGKPLDIVQQNQTKIVNNFKGDRFNTSVGGTILGMHADIFIKDDLVSAEQANSDVERDKANRWNDETTSSRRKVPFCYLDVYISQRLHENDVCGHVLKKNLDITWICLPSEITATNKHTIQPESAIELYTDGILDPNRRPKDVLEVLREEMGANGYNGQYLQVPFNLEDQDITPSMFKRIKEKELPSNLTWDVWIDGAFTEKTENDPTGIALICKHGKNMITRKMFNVRKKLPDLLSFVKHLEQDGWFDAQKSRIFIEPKASGYPLAQYIESDTEYNFVLIGEHNKIESKLVNAGKKARHELIKPKAESGRLFVVEDDTDDTWIDEYTTQICGFPRAAHDEAVDIVGYAANHYYNKENAFIADWALNKLQSNLMGSFNVMLTHQEVKARNGAITFAVSFDDNDSGDVQMFENPDTHYNNRYITTVVLKSEAERGGTSCIMVYDRTSKAVVSMYDHDIINPRKIAIKALSLAYMYDTSKLVVAIKKEVGSGQNEESDISHMVIQEIRSIGYSKMHSRLTVNNIKKKREKEFGFEVNRSTSREVYLNLKDQIETNKIKSLPLEVFEDISVLERKKETGEIDGQDGREVNRGLAYAISLKVDKEWSDKPILKLNRRNSWAT